MLKYTLRLLSLSMLVFGCTAIAENFSIPDQVFLIAEAEVQKREREKITLGDAIRYFDHVSCERLSGKMNLHELTAMNDTARIKYYIPVYANEALAGLVLISKYPGSNNFVFAGYNPPTYMAYAIDELARTWPASSGYSPYLIDCHYAKLFHIPQLGDSNLTPIATGFTNIDTSLILRRSEFQKLLIAARAKTDTEVRKIARSFEEVERNSAKQPALRKRRLDQSDFRRTESLHRTNEWLIEARKGRVR